MRLFGNLALLLATLVLSAGVGEGVLRLLPSQSGATERNGEVKYRFNPFRPDGVLGHALRADAVAVHETDDFHVTVHTNALGLRGAPVDPVKPPGTLRVLVLGDSFAFGFGVADDESFPALLGTELARRLGQPVEVLNAGVPGWSTDHHLLFLRTQGFALEPDLVLVALTENDPGDLGWNRVTVGEDRLPVRIESLRRLIDHRGRMRYVKGSPSFEFPGSDWLSDHSYLFHWFRFRVTKIWISLSQDRAMQRLREEAGEPPTEAVESLSPAAIQRGLLTGREFQLRYHDFLMAAIERQCGDRGIPVRTLLIAFRPGDRRPEGAEALHEKCARSEDTCLDTRGFFSEGETAQVFFESDAHWTPAGHRRAAERLVEWLTADPRPILQILSTDDD